MIHVLIYVLLLCAASGCVYGTTAEKFTPASDPLGVTVRLDLGGSALHGELLEVRDADLVVLSSLYSGTQERKLRLVPYQSIRRGDFHQLGKKYALVEGRAPAPAVRERLRLVSRYPYGIPAPALTELLKSTGQSALAGIQP